MSDAGHYRAVRFRRVARPAAIHLSELQYELPEDRIAQRPVEPRDASRLMIVHCDAGRIEHRTFRDLPECLASGDVLVLNRTSVLPAKFVARRPSGGQIRGLFISERRPGCWEAMLSPLRRVRFGEPMRLGDGRWTVRLTERLDRGRCIVEIDPPDAAAAVLDAVGSTPLPPYIRRGEDRSGDAEDRARYQTVYADRPGAVAAPTAGLHMTERLLARLGELGINTAFVTLHVGLGTFQPVEVQELSNHRMHREWYEYPARTADALRATRQSGGRVVAVGTTAVRVLETAAAADADNASEGWTDIFIYPPYRFRAVDAMVTNFHLPGSTLLALVYAFGGVELMRAAYREAIEKGYRFYSYGDAMLII